MRQGCCHTHLASPADRASGPNTLCSLENPVRQRRRQPTTDSSFRPEAAATFGSNAAICRSDRLVMRTGARPIVLVAGIARSPIAIGKTLEASFRRPRRTRWRYPDTGRPSEPFADREDESFVPLLSVTSLLGER